MPDNSYLQPLSRIINTSFVPEKLGFIKEISDVFFSRFLFKNYRVIRYSKGGGYLYFLDLVFPVKAGIEIPGTGITFLINPPVNGNEQITEFNISLEFKWKVLQYLHDFKLQNFSFDKIGVINIFKVVFITVDSEILEAIDKQENSYTTEEFDIQYLIDTLNIEFELEGTANEIIYNDNPETTIQDVLTALTSAGISIEDIISKFNVITDYPGGTDTAEDILIKVGTVPLYYEPTDTSKFIAQLNEDFNLLSTPEEIIYIPDTTYNDIAIALDNAGISIIEVIPFYILSEVESLDDIQELLISFFTSFKKRLFTSDYKDIFIPKIKFEVNNLNLALEFPRTVLKPIDPATNEPYEDENIKSLLRFTVGSLLFSTEHGLEFKNESSFDFQKSQIGNTGFTLEFTDMKLDLSRTKNIPEAAAYGYDDDFVGAYVEHANIGLPKLFSDSSTPSTTSIIGRNFIIGTGGISGTLGLDDPEGLIEVQLGGFTIWFDAFSLTFLQNSITGSDIHGRLKIPGFKDTTGADAIINIDIAITNDGDFKITGREVEGIAIKIPEIFSIIIKELSIGKKDDLFFLKVSGGLEIIHPKLKEYLKGVIDIKGLTIWSDGHFEIEGGSLPLPKPISLKVGPAEISITAIHLGSHEQYHGGVMRQYKYFGFDGGVSVNPGGVDARGDGIKFYFTTDGLGPLHVFLRIESIYIDIIIPGDASPERAAVLLQGYLSMKGPDADDPESQPGTEYIGGVAFSLPQINLAGSAAMRMNPKIPSFLVDIGLELPVPIPLGPTGLGIYGFRSLLGLRYVASREYLDVATWYEYYKAVA